MKPTHRSAVLVLLRHNVVTNDLSVFLSVTELCVTTPRNPFIPFTVELSGACLSASVFQNNSFVSVWTFCWQKTKQKKKIASPLLSKQKMFN